LNKDLVTVGKIEKAFGLRGELRVHPEVFYEDFVKFQKFIVISPKGGKKVLQVERFRSGAGNTIIIKFKGIDSREVAEKLAGLNLLVPEEELPGTDVDEFYVKDLIGCKIFHLSQEVGLVSDYLAQGKIGSLVVMTKEGVEILIPFVKRFIEKIDLEKKEIEVKDLDDLKELNR
jgi:16S rRNA processing protein RimM